eukprot:4075585-Amphidinium_carterae.1
MSIEAVFTRWVVSAVRGSSVAFSSGEFGFRVHQMSCNSPSETEATIYVWMGPKALSGGLGLLRLSTPLPERKSQILPKTRGQCQALIYTPEVACGAG